MDECKYKNDIEQLKTDRTTLQQQYSGIKEDLSEIKADIRELLHNGVIDKKVESAVAKLFFRFVLAAIGSGGGVAAFISWLANRGG